MHYYSHHIGDYQRETAQLSIVEHGVYRLLLDHYFVTEKPLTSDIEALCRIIRARGKVERGALRTIISTFNRRKANARRNGKMGGRPQDEEGEEQGEGEAEPALELKLESAPKTRKTTSCTTTTTPTTPSHTLSRTTPDYPLLKEVLAWADRVPVAADCAKKWHAERDSEDWVSRSGHPLSRDRSRLERLFRTYATAWNANESRIKGKSSAPHASAEPDDGRVF